MMWAKGYVSGCDIERSTDRAGGPPVFVEARDFSRRCDGATDPAIIEFHDTVVGESRQPFYADPPSQPAPADPAWHRGRA